jgi:hypothetical protein
VGGVILNAGNFYKPKGICGKVAPKVKGPELGISGPALRGVGNGRGLVARDAVCVKLNVPVSDSFVQYYF